MSTKDKYKAFTNFPLMPGSNSVQLPTQILIPHLEQQKLHRKNVDLFCILYSTVKQFHFIAKKNGQKLKSK